MSTQNFVALLSAGRNAAFDKVNVAATDHDHALSILKAQDWLRGRGNLCQLTLSDGKTVEEYRVFKNGSTQMTDSREIGQ